MAIHAHALKLIDDKTVGELVRIKATVLTAHLLLLQVQLRLDILDFSCCEVQISRKNLASDILIVSELDQQDCIGLSQSLLNSFPLFWLRLDP